MKAVTAICYILATFPALGEAVVPGDVYVIDGDTVDWRGNRFRLVGYDTPETYRAKCDSEKRLGDLATARMRQLLDQGSVVELVQQPGQDQYGRYLGRLFANGRDVGEILISEGLARPYSTGQRLGWCG